MASEEAGFGVMGLQSKDTKDYQESQEAERGKEVSSLKTLHDGRHLNFISSQRCEEPLLCCF